MPIAQVAELLVRWRGAGGLFDRARVLREATQLLGGLDAHERRLLARSLAEQGAPDLASRIEQRTGGTLSADQLGSVANGLLTMDDEQVDRLATSLRDPAERERLAREALIPGVSPYDPRPGPVSDGPPRSEEPPPPAGSPDPTAVASSEPQRREEWLGDQELGDQELGDQELGDQELGDQELGTATLGDAGIVDVGLYSPGPDVPTTTPLPDPDQQGDGAARQLDPGLGGPVALPVAADARIPDAEDTPTAPGDEQAWHEQLRAAQTATERFRLLDPDLLAGLDSTMAMALLDALPEGWQRRRAAARLVDAGTFPTDRLAEAFTRFARPTDAVFIAGALLAADQVRAERFDGILPTRAFHRLAARSER